jgi:hypothetical protein
MAGLADVKAIRYYAQFLRPAQFPAVPPPNPAPACDAASQTARSVQTDFTRKNYTVVVAYYPGGDTACAQSPTAVLEMYYPGVGGPAPQVGFGYQVFFNGAGQPQEYDVLRTAVYRASPLNVDTQVDRFDPASVPLGFVQPGPGKFPATFPLDFPLPNPLPQTLQPQSFDSDYYASVGSAAGTAQLGTASTVETNPDFFQSNTGGATQFVGTLDLARAAVSGPDRAGDYAYVAAHPAPAYAFDLLGRIGIAGGTYQLGPSTTTWRFAPIASGFVAQNFGGGATDAATYSGAGSFVSDRQTYTDRVNRVEVQIAFDAATQRYSVVVTDQLRKAPATSPSPIVLDRDGAGIVPYSYVFDGSPGSILDFTVVQ